MQSNIRVACNAGILVVAMVGLTYASVPLYRMFCQVTGFGGTTQEAPHAPGAVVGAREFTVRFNADVAPGLRWRFAPGVKEMRVKIGEQSLTSFVAENPDYRSSRGHAVYNVTPHSAGAYFTKIHCFCFEEQMLNGYQKVDMPVSFFIDPEILKDPEMKNLSTITLSYTFFPSDTAPVAREK